ncbi:MAG: histidine kinase dimerization/phospho-acceptor domain-containing protein [Bacteriovorax sp.]
MHDIRNPLTTIKVGAQLILKSPEKLDRNQTILKKLVRSCKSTRRICSSRKRQRTGNYFHLKTSNQ